MDTYSLPDHGTTSQLSLLSADLEKATQLIIKSAGELMNKLIEHRGTEEPPFLAEEFAPLLGIKEIQKTDLGEVDAFLVRSVGGYVIRVNTNHSAGRQNFSCAHEIGHILLDEFQHPALRMGTDSRGETGLGGGLRERLCNIAAAELLMPERIFSKYLNSFRLSINSMEYLARIFRVSIRAAAIRVAEVSQERCLAILWQPWRKRKSKGLRLAWVVGPGRQPRGKDYPLPRNTYIVEHSKLYKAYESESIVSSFKSLKLGNGKRRCYMESKGFGFGENRYVLSLVFLDR